jgi:hypothetical protein
MYQSTRIGYMLVGYISVLVQLAACCKVLTVCCYVHRLYFYNYNYYYYLCKLFAICVTL